MSGDNGELPGSLYRLAPWVVVRTPALPADQIDLARHPRTALDDPAVVRALAIGAPDLLETLQRSTAGDRDRRRAQRSLARYLIRMSTRPTPFGAFAGVSLAAWAPRTTLALGDEQTTRTRPDMGWVIGLLRELEADPEIRARCRWQRHPLVYEQNGRFQASGSGPSVRATAAARAALDVAAQPVAYETLCDRVRELTSGTKDQVADLLAELWRNELLRTDLRPQLTGPAATSGAQVVELLRPLRPETADSVSDLLAQIDAFDRAAPAEAATRLVSIREAAKAISADSDAVLQTDLRQSLAADGFSRRVGAECVRAAEVLLRLTPSPAGSADLQRYTRSFLARYGEDGQVSLPELFDPVRGLGPMPHTHGTAAAADSARAAQRADTLQNLALGALHDGLRAVEVNNATIAALQTWRPRPDEAPVSLDVSAFVVAASPAEIDDGRFLLVVGPNLGAASAGRWLGRFADLFGPEADRAYEWLVAAESDAQPGAIAAEVVYLPSNPRSANVVLRPTTARHEIGVDARTAAEHSIDLADIVVGVRGGRLYLRSATLGCDIRPTARHMLNHHGAPPVCQFLDEVARGAGPTFSGFDWGPAESLPFLPRVQYGRVVLEPARWLLPVRADEVAGQKDELSRFAAALAARRSHWDIPSRIFVSTADNRMLLDLDHADDVAQLYREARNQRGGSLRLAEALPDVSDAWLPGPRGNYLCEIVASLVLRPTAPVQPRGTVAVGDQRPVARASPPPLITDRIRPPSSDWLFVKLYSAPDNVDRLMSGPIGDLLEMAENSGLARRWFFLRYADPDPHLRIRWQGDPDVLLRHLLPHVAGLAAQLIESGHLSKLVVDTYERELERYGGPRGTDVSESVFHADSRAVAELLRLLQRPIGLDVTELVALTLDDLLTGLGLDEPGRLAFYERQTAMFDDEELRRSSGADYRSRKSRLRRILGSGRMDGVDPAIESILATRREELEVAARQLADLAANGELGTSLENIYASYLHMHLNRLVAGGTPPSEGHLLHLLARAQKSLVLAPSS